jgi:hypothetical protein
MTCTEEKFLRYVAEHQMQVLRDDGVYRHLRFQKPGTSIHWFDIVTWPGYLSITGDVGDYLFSRLEDMFQFFRDKRGGRDGRLHINEDYWAQKLQAQSCNGRYCEGVRRWCAEKFERAIKEQYVEYVCAEMRGMPGERKELRAALEEDVLSRSEDEHGAKEAVYYFDEYGLRFEDFYEVDYTEWDFKFVWCLYAIVWGIQQYDAAKPVN